MTANDIQFHVDSTMLDSYPEIVDKFNELGIPTMIESSSRESEPLGRVEWVKLFGVLFGMEDEADAYFQEQKALVDSVDDAETADATAAFGYLGSDGKCSIYGTSHYIVQMAEMAGWNYIIYQDAVDEEKNTVSTSFEEWYAAFKDADYLFYYNIVNKFYSIQDMLDYNPLLADFKAVKEGHVYVTSPDFTQSTAAIASIIADMNTILTSDDPEVTTDHLVRLS